MSILEEIAKTCAELDKATAAGPAAVDVVKPTAEQVTEQAPAEDTPAPVEIEKGETN